MGLGLALDAEALMVRVSGVGRRGIFSMRLSPWLAQLHCSGSWRGWHWT